MELAALHQARARATQPIAHTMGRTVAIGAKLDVNQAGSVHIPAHTMRRTIAHGAQLDLNLTDSVHQNMLGERNATMAKTVQQVGAHWPCGFGEVVVGKVDGEKPSYKFVCGLGMMSMVVKPIVYSFGSRNEIAFEESLLQRRPDCELHIFDPFALPSEANQHVLRALGNVSFHKLGVRGGEDVKHKGIPLDSLAGIMQRLSHRHVDILKVDCEGCEWNLMESEGNLLSRVGQLQVEVHSGIQASSYHRRKFGFPKRELSEFARGVEAQGLRIFRKEAQWAHGSDCCVELAFIQRDWLQFERQKLQGWR